MNFIIAVGTCSEKMGIYVPEDRNLLISMDSVADESMSQQALLMMRNHWFISWLVCGCGGPN